MPRLALVLGLILLAAAGLARGIPYLTDEREYVAVTPQPDPLFGVALVPLWGGQVACMEDAVLDPRSEEARFRVGTFYRPPVPLELTIAGGSYAEHVSVTPDYRDSEVIRVPIDPPERETPVSICIRNLGDRRVALYGSADRTNSRSLVTVDGRPVVPDFGIVLYERKPTSILDRLPTSVQRATVFRGPLTADLLWIVLVLFAVGTPVGVLLALAWSLRGDDN
jgi:hypothetical protein